MAEKKLILLVDDDPDFVDAVRIIVESGGYEVITAYDGKEGLEAVAERKPDLIILDVMMPFMNGHQVCAELKSDTATKEIPIILLTAVAERITSSTYTHFDMLASEAEDYIAKPIKPEELLESIQGWLNC